MRRCSEPLLQEPNNLWCNETHITTGFINRAPQPEMWRARYRGSPDEKLGLLQGEKKVL